MCLGGFKHTRTSTAARGQSWCSSYTFHEKTLLDLMAFFQVIISGMAFFGQNPGGLSHDLEDYTYQYQIYKLRLEN